MYVTRNIPSFLPIHLLVTCAIVRCAMLCCAVLCFQKHRLRSRALSDVTKSARRSSSPARQVRGEMQVGCGGVRPFQLSCPVPSNNQPTDLPACPPARLPACSTAAAQNLTQDTYMQTKPSRAKRQEGKKAIRQTAPRPRPNQIRSDQAEGSFTVGIICALACL